MANHFKRLERNQKTGTGISLFLGTLLLSLSVITGCTTAENTGTSPDSNKRPEGWTEETHSNNVDPNYEMVFPEDQVNQIKITISPENWEAMQTNMTELYGQSGTGGNIGGGMGPNNGRQQPPTGGMVPQNGGQLPGNTVQGQGGLVPPAGDTVNMTQDQGQMPFQGGNMGPGQQQLPPDAGNFTQGMQPGSGNFQPPVNAQDNLNNGIPGWADMASENPSWVTSTIEFNGVTWTDVGIRYKGNSSLSSSWRQGSSNLPFKLDFDEFEDQYPEINNQRFYGFKQISFSNAFNDGTYMHDALASKLLEDSGLPAARTAWYNVQVDYGEGVIDLGLYVAVEVVDDTVIDRFFGDDSGNIYEGDGRGVSLAQGTYSLIEDSFQKENNEGSDWSDIANLYNILNSETRTTDPAAWRTELEATFDVDTFLNWLSINAVLEDWDTYGSMTHNFYLYDDPETGQLTWISWDHNEILSGNSGAANGNDILQARNTMKRTVSFDRTEITDQWPLIRFLLDDPVYYARYLYYMRSFIDGAFNPEELEAWCTAKADLLTPYIAASQSSTFNSSVQALITTIGDRYLETSDFLRSEGN